MQYEITVVRQGKARQTRQQIEAFVRFLAAQQAATLVLGVPWPAAVTARQLAERYLRTLNVKHVKVVICDGQSARAATDSAE